MRVFIKYSIYFLVFFLMYLFQYSFAQNSVRKADSLKVQKTTADTIAQISSTIESEGEIVLEEITIEAIVEKPRVSILPKRIDPELGELEFVDRSFEKELKKFPNSPMINDKRLFEPDKMENLKKTLQKKKSKKNKELF